MTFASVIYREPNVCDRATLAIVAEEDPRAFVGAGPHMRDILGKMNFLMRKREYAYR